MTKQSINQLNWTFCQRINGSLRVLVHLAAEPIPNSIDTVREFYIVNVLNEKDFALSQKEFETLDLALAFMENSYGHWTFQNQLADLESKGGCSSCAAH
jgi:hypothetical protein